MLRYLKNTYAASVSVMLLGTVTVGFAEPAGSLLPDTVEIAAGDFQYRLSGEFLQDGYPADAPKVSIHFSRPLHVMKYQVSNHAYASCVEDKACGLPFKRKRVVADDRPVTGVSFKDAQDFAGWLTRKTGVTWRLPSDAEWAYAAGSRFHDDALGAKDAASDPSERALLKYQQTIDLGLESDSVVKTKGAYGANEHGVFDQSGNVWEWTDTCYTRSKISAAGEIMSADSGNCGVRVVEGQHRSYMTFFIQDAKSGGSAVGRPPDYLGFRLVRDNPALFSRARMRNWWRSLTGG